MSKSHRLAEFPTDWHQQSYVEGLVREIIGYERRLGELPEDAERARADAQAGLEAARAELVRVTGQKAAAKRPRGSQAEKR